MRNAPLRPTAAAEGRTDFQKRAQTLKLVNQERPMAIVDRAGKGDYGTAFVQGASANAKPGEERRTRSTSFRRT